MNRKIINAIVSDWVSCRYHENTERKQRIAFASDARPRQADSNNVGYNIISGESKGACGAVICRIHRGFVLSLILFFLSTVAGQNKVFADQPEIYEHLVQPGDSCWSLAERYLGDGKKFKLIYKYNKLGPPPALLKPGTIVRIPAKPEAPDALVKWLHRDVKAKAPYFTKWRTAKEKMPLWRLYKVSTGDNASAGIEFENNSAIRMRENALLVIYGGSSTRSKTRKRTRRSVVIEEGEIEAGIGKLDRKQGVADATESIEIKTPGSSITVSGPSAKIGVSKNKTSTVAVYKGSASIKSRGKKVVVAEDYGTRVIKGKKPEKPRLLPIAPKWSASNKNVFFFFPDDPIHFRLQWNASMSASGYATSKYRVSLARDREFKKPILHALIGSGITSFEARDLEEGVYFARVSAIDEIDLEGKASSIAQIFVRQIALPRQTSAPHPAAPGTVPTAQQSGVRQHKKADYYVSGYTRLYFDKTSMPTLPSPRAGSQTAQGFDTSSNVVMPSSTQISVDESPYGPMRNISLVTPGLHRVRIKNGDINGLDNVVLDKTINVRPLAGRLDVKHLFLDGKPKQYVSQPTQLKSDQLESLRQPFSVKANIVHIDDNSPADIPNVDLHIIGTDYTGKESRISSTGLTSDQYGTYRTTVSPKDDIGAYRFDLSWIGGVLASATRTFPDRYVDNPATSGRGWVNQPVANESARPHLGVSSRAAEPSNSIGMSAAVAQLSRSASDLGVPATLPNALAQRHGVSEGDTTLRLAVTASGAWFNRRFGLDINFPWRLQHLENTDSNGSQFGSIRLGARIVALRSQIMSLALSFRGTIPSHSLTAELGDIYGFEPAILADFRFGPVHLYTNQVFGIEETFLDGIDGGRRINYVSHLGMGLRLFKGLVAPVAELSYLRSLSAGSHFNDQNALGLGGAIQFYFTHAHLAFSGSWGLTNDYKSAIAAKSASVRLQVNF